MDLHHHLHRRLLVHRVNSTDPGSKESLTGGSNFDTNMLFILAALLCALILALGLNSIVRCACLLLRCSHRLAFETPEEAAARLASKGLKKSALNQIPVVVYGSGSASTSIAATDCAICLGEFVDGEKVRVLPKCNHGFHVKCIDKWLLSHSSCPNCRQSLLDPPSMSEAATVAVAVVADAGTTRHVENSLGGHEPGTLAIAVDEVG
uniref:RING-type E3 ubiquitin transferase n=1 Tax=Lotus japonicus TaxID=34305 RepID=I3SIC0_LOTJA|nr:unknown [Lotus japonicus]